jgi:sialate O-acetylesterase
MQKTLLILTFYFSLFNTQVVNALQLAKVFTDNMVLQQQQVVPVWGKAKAGSNVNVSFLTQSITTIADENGDWKIELSPLKASYTPAKLIIDADEKVIINNVLVGEVWLSSGQSNMRFTLTKSLGGKKAITQSKNNKLRLLDFTDKKFYPEEKIFDVEELEKLNPANYFQSQGWQSSNPVSSKNFSAVAYHFALHLQQQLDVPVGIINVSIGGSLMESFISKDKLASIKPLAKLNGYWLDNIPLWCANRARYNLSSWLEKYPNALPNHPFKPSFLFDAGIKPIMPFAIKGVIWYQGESNAPIEYSSSPYQGEFKIELSKLKFKALISDWRAQWNNNQLPFYMVQLPGLNRPWAQFRQLQSDIAKEVANTGMAITYDLGHSTNVHPKNKQPVGHRLALLALSKSYDKDLVAHGPVFSHTEQDKSSIKVIFETVDNGDSALAILDSSKKLKGFEIAAADGVFIAARAVIENDYIIVSHSNISVPIMLRYGWFDNPKYKANLGNKAGLPAGPFNSKISYL